MPSAAVLSLPSSKNMPGHDITPAAVRDALQGGSPGKFPNSRSSWPDCDDECCGEAGCSTGDGATPPSASPAHSMEANALLWAVGNLWFGVEQDMTSYAYTVCVSSCLAVKGGLLIILLLWDERVEQVLIPATFDDRNCCIGTAGTFQARSERCRSRQCRIL